VQARPLVLTAGLPAPEQAWLDGRRAELFPPERNHLAAHLTLFHAPPAARLEPIAAALEAALVRLQMTGLDVHLRRPRARSSAAFAAT
jgi:hypothetical protein